MQKILFSFIAIIGISSISTANASSIATITKLQSPVWVQQNNTKTELGQNSVLKIGDRIITGKSGRVEMLLWASVALQLNANSEITIDIQPELYIRKGRACIKFVSRPDTRNKFKLNIGNTMFAAMQHQGDICVLRKDGMSSIVLRSGSVQVTHSVDPNLIVLSEAGTEFRINDDGSNKLLFPGSDDSLTSEIEFPVTVEATIGEASPSDALDVDDGKIVASEEATTVETGLTTQESLSGYKYTVYLFSTRSEDVAEEVNRKFQEAGHDTRIYVSETDSETRYRIAVPGFKSAQAAQMFSDSVVGKLGIRDTWIGKERQKN
jgi:hypothetical protein